MIKVTGIAETIAKLNKDVSQDVKEKKLVVMNKAINLLALGTPVDTGRAQNGWHIEGDTIVNRVPYISDLNKGHSPQAPERFVETILISMPEVKPDGVIVREVGE
jgi:hypothetical protein